MPVRWLSSLFSSLINLNHILATADETKPPWREIARSALLALLPRRALACAFPSDLRLRKGLYRQLAEFGSRAA
jgi:hypothetical protein